MSNESSDQMQVQKGDVVWFHPDTQIPRKSDRGTGRRTGPWMESKNVRRGTVVEVDDQGMVRVSTRNSAGPGRTGFTTWRVRPERVTSVTQNRPKEA